MHVAIQPVVPVVMTVVVVMLVVVFVVLMPVTMMAMFPMLFLLLFQGLLLSARLGGSPFTGSEGGQAEDLGQGHVATVGSYDAHVRVHMAN